MFHRPGIPAWVLYICSIVSQSDSTRQTSSCHECFVRHKRTKDQCGPALRLDTVHQHFWSWISWESALLHLTSWAGTICQRQPLFKKSSSFQMTDGKRKSYKSDIIRQLINHALSSKAESVAQTWWSTIRPHSMSRVFVVGTGGEWFPQTTAKAGVTLALLRKYNWY